VTPTDDHGSGAHNATGSATYPRIGATDYVSGLTAGINTVTAKYKTQAGTAQYEARHVVVRRLN
jgi:hypothetical protein